MFIFEIFPLLFVDHLVLEPTLSGDLVVTLSSFAPPFPNFFSPLFLNCIARVYTSAWPSQVGLFLFSLSFNLPPPFFF